MKNTMDKITIKEKFALFNDTWSPKIIAQANGQLVKLAKGSGELVWHSHDNEDELFLVFEGELTLRFREGEVTLMPGDMYVVPKGVEHCPVAKKDTHFLMIEPASTAHTGNTLSEKTVSIEEQEWI